ncbi:MAG: hypothetical protein RL368_458 [Pseudomonadota bacterium]|jgi:hypothetical protein
MLKNNQKHLREDLLKQVDKLALGEYVWQQSKHAVFCQLQVWEVSSPKLRFIVFSCSFFIE